MNGIEKTIAALNKKGFTAVYAQDAAQANAYVLSHIGDDDTVGAGGSVTLSELEIIDTLLARGNAVLSSTVAKKNGKDPNAARHAGLDADVYLSSANAVTEDGVIINIDGIGNRVAGLFYGPPKVIIVAGKNKIAKNQSAAIARIKKIACPKNARRLGLNTPCGLTGKCGDCNSPDRMCNVTVLLECPTHGKEVHVVLIDGDFGY